MFPMWDCPKCGGFYPGSPNAYMGTFCRCEPPKPKTIQEFLEEEEDSEEDSFDWENASSEDIRQEIDELTAMRISLSCQGLDDAAASYDLVIEGLKEILAKR